MSEHNSNWDRWMFVFRTILLIIFVVLGFPTEAGFGYMLLFVVFTAGLVFWNFSGSGTSPVGTRSQGLLFGTRVPGWFMGEGWHSTPWPTGRKEQDCRSHVIQLDVIIAVTKDGVEMKSEPASLLVKINDLGWYFDLNPEHLDQLVDDVMDQDVRKRVRESANFADVLGMTFDPVSQPFMPYLEILRINVPNLLPTDKEVLAAMQGVERETLEQDTQLKEAETITKVMEVLLKPRADGTKMSEEKAHETALLIVKRAESKKLIGLTMDPAILVATNAILGRN